MIDTKELRRLVQAAISKMNARDPEFASSVTPLAVLELLDRLEAAESECLEQARLNGMGSEREAALMAKLEAAEKDIAVKEEVIDSLAAVVKRLDAQCDAAEKERDFAKTEIARLHDDIRELTDERVLDEEDRVLLDTLVREAKAKLDSLEATEKDSAHHKALAESALRVAKGWEDKCDELRAKIEQMERQEPVAWRTFDGEGGYDYRSYEDNENYKLGWDARNPNHIGWVEPLYALPGAKGE